MISSTAGYDITSQLQSPDEQSPDDGSAGAQLSQNQQDPGDLQDIFDNTVPPRKTGNDKCTTDESGANLDPESGPMHVPGAQYETVSPQGHPGMALTQPSIMLQTQYQNLPDSHQEPQTRPHMESTIGRNIGGMQKIMANIARLDQSTQALQQALRDSERSKEELEYSRQCATIVAGMAPTEPSISLVSTAHPQVAIWDK